MKSSVNKEFRQLILAEIEFLNLIMPLPNKTEKEMDHIFFNLFKLDPEDEEDSNEEDSSFMSILNDTSPKYGINTISLLPCEDLRSAGLNLPILLAVKVKSLKFYLKHLK